MGTITKTYEFVDATTAEAEEVNTNFDTIYNEFNGNIDNANVKAAAAIAGSKLDLSSVTTMTTSGNVTIGGTLTQTGVATFTATPKTDTIAEKTAATGVTIDGVVLKDSAVTASGKSTFGATVQTVTTYTPAAAGTATVDVSLGNINAITMPAGNITIAISNETVGQCFIIEITQDGTGSRTVTWFTTIKWVDGTAPTLTTTASKRDVLGFRVTGTDTYDGYIIGQNI